MSLVGVSTKRAGLLTGTFVLCKKIPYFEKMFKAEFKEVTENQATFPEDNAESFDLLLGWVYHNSIRPLTVLRKDGTSNESFESWSRNKFSILAEKLCLSDLQDQIMDEYIEYLVRENLYPSVADIGHIRQSRLETHFASSVHGSFIGQFLR